MKKHFLLFSLLTLGAGADNLESLLSSELQKQQSFQRLISQNKSKIVEYSWINPVMVTLSRNYTTRINDEAIGLNSASIAISQPIFKSGGIYYALKYANASKLASLLKIKASKKEMIAKALKLAYDYKIALHEHRKLQLMLENYRLQIRLREPLFRDGLMDASMLDEAYIKRDEMELKVDELQIRMEQIKEAFAKISDKAIERVELPNISIPSKSQFIKKYLPLIQADKSAKVKYFESKMTKSKYLPQLSLETRYIREDINPLFRFARGLQEEYVDYGLKLTLPLSLTFREDIEASKLAWLNEEVTVVQKQKEATIAYERIMKNVNLLERSKKTVKRRQAHYQRMIREVDAYYKAGEKSKEEVQLLRNQASIAKIDGSIYDLKIKRLLTEFIGLMNGAL